ncbi:CBM96 family carbohydrate-binding protein [Paenibacillus puerhi]|uniref:CBM96 family carbohydrate-binding protein n=1 Tax=Paenibacillus puerhi TaxID=2692622 RepID=UPI001357CDB5|nr:DNRLRE domain-containing protein [Paenibacillus puerhi]
MKKHIALLMIISLLITVFNGPIPAKAEEFMLTETYTLYPEADTFVRSGAPTQTFENDPKLLVNAGRISYLRFDLSGVMGVVTGAALQLYKADANTNTLSVTHIVYDDWATNMNYNNRVSVRSGAIGDVLVPGFLSKGKDSTISVESEALTSKVISEKQLDGKISLMIDNVSGSNFANEFYSSRGTNKPALVVTAARPATPGEVALWDLTDLGLGSGSVISQNLPVTGQRGSMISYVSNDASIIAGDGTVTRPPWLEGDKTVQLAVYSTYLSETRTQTYQVVVPKDPAADPGLVAAADLEALKLYNGKYITDDLPSIGAQGARFTYTSSNPTVISHEGYLTKPLQNEEEASVQVTVTATYMGEMRSSTYTLVASPLQEQEPGLRDSLARVIAIAENYAAAAVVGAGAGEVTQASKDALTAKIQRSRVKLDDPHTDYRATIDSLVQAGSAMIRTSALSYKVTNAQANTVEYSVYRQTLRDYVWQAETLLVIQPEYHTQEDQVALKYQIDLGKSLLSNTYSLPFAHNRKFRNGRIDDVIQTQLKYATYVTGYASDGGYYGIIPAVESYKNTSYLSRHYSSTVLYPTDDTFVTGLAPGVPQGTSQRLQLQSISGFRSAFMKFDLGSIGKEVLSAKLKVTNAKSDNKTVYVNVFGDDAWQENTLTRNLLPKESDNSTLKLGPQILTGNLGGVWDVTEAVAGEKVKDGMITFTVRVDSDTTHEFYSKEATAQDTWPAVTIMSRKIDMSKVADTYQQAVQYAEGLLKEASVGGGIGQYKEQAAIDQVRTVLEQLKTDYASANPYTVAGTIVRLYDTAREMRSHQVLRLQVDPDSTLFYTSEEMAKLREDITKSPLKEQYEYLKSLSDEMTAEQLRELNEIGITDNPDYNLLNSKYKVWSNIKNVSFTAPEGAKFASMEITLLPSSNEQEGLGHVWVDDIRVYPTTFSGDLQIPDPSFEENGLSNWSPVVVKGNPVLQAEQRPTYVATGRQSIYIANPTANDQGKWKLNSDFPLTATDNKYSLIFNVKIDGRFKNDAGVELVFIFKDKDGHVIRNGLGEPETRKVTGATPSAIGVANANLYMQADALVYAVTGDIEYAQKAKHRIKWTLNDILQGAENWNAGDKRPFGIDAYGQVQAGRNATSIASAYSMIKNAPSLYSAEERQYFYAQLQYLFDYLTDLRDRNELTEEQNAAGTTNWQTDMSIGAGLLALTIPEYPNARAILDNSMALIEGQLVHHVNSDGGWPESLRYHSATLGKVAPFVRALRVASGAEWFSEYVTPMLNFLMLVHTPAYEYFDSEIGTPGFGDHTTGNGDVFVPFANYLDEVEKTDPKLAAQLYETYIRAGKPAGGYHGESLAIQNFFLPSNTDNKDNVGLELGSSAYTGDTGYLIFRNNFNRSNESYLVQMAREVYMGHQHADNGSFILYSGGEPLVHDPGVQSYFDGSTAYYNQSSNHSAATFLNSSGSPVNNPDLVKQEDFYASQAMDYSRVDLSSDLGTYKRHIAYVKNGMDAYVIWDQMKGSGSTSGTLYTLPLASTGTSVDGVKVDTSGNGFVGGGTKVQTSGYYGTGLETTVLEPAHPKISVKQGGSSNMFPATNGTYLLDMFRVEAAPDQNFLTVLYPVASGGEGIKETSLAVDIAGVTAYKIEMPGGKWMIVAANNNATLQTVDLPVPESLVDLRTGIGYPVSGTAVPVQVEGNGLMILKPGTLAAPVPTDIEYTGVTEVVIPSNGVVNIPLRGIVLDQYNNNIIQCKNRVVDLCGTGTQDVSLTWSLTGSPEGISLDEKKGIITVTSVAKQSEVIVTAASAGISRPVVLNLTKQDNGSTPPADPTSPTDPTDPTDTTNPTPVNPSNSSPPITSAPGASNGQEKAVVVPKTPSKVGNAAVATVNADEWRTTLRQVKQDGLIRVELAKTEQATAYQLVFPSEAISAQSGQTQLEIVTPLGTVRFPSTLFKSGELPHQELVFKITEHDPAGLDSMARQQIGNRPVLDLSLMSGDKVVEWNKPDAPVTVSIPYTPTAEEKSTEHLVIWYLNDQGQIVPVVNSKYVASTGSVTFKTTHFSRYAVAYVTKTFNDIAEMEWAKKQIEVLASRGIVTGVSEAQFHPSAEVTRADFLLLLTRVLELNAPIGEAFSDVPEEAYYAKAVHMARTLGITEGSGNNQFRPMDSITREDMMVLAARAIQLSKQVNLSSSSTALSMFKDSGQVASYAQKSVDMLVSSGLISGYDERIHPHATTDRAQAAVLMYRIFNLMSH